MADNNAVTVANLEVVLSYRTKGDPKKIINKTQESLANVGKTSKETGNKVNKMFESLKRIATYRLLRTALKELAQGLREGVNNLVLWDKTVANTSFANKTMSELGSILIQLKNTIGAAFMPILQLVQPAIEAITNAVITATNVINQFIRALQGYGTYIKANRDNNYDYADSLKAMKRQLLGFDELNVLKDNSGSGNGQSYEGMFKEVDIGSGIKDHFNEILTIVELIGAGIAAWKITDKLNTDLFQTFGYFTTIIGAVQVFEGLMDQINNGVDLSNLNQILMGTSVIMVGLMLVTKSLDGMFIGLGIGGVALIIGALSEFIKTGEMSAQAFDQLRIGITLLAVALAPLTGGWSLLAGAIGIAATLIIQNWDKIKAAWTNLTDNLKTKFANAVDAIKRKIEEFKKAFAESGIGQFLSGVGSGISNAASGVKNVVSGIGSGISNAISGIKNFFSGNYASGGIPPMGSMFVAGETGDPEFVGNVGGRTAVYNSDQLAGSLASANEMVVDAIFQAVSAINSAIANQPTPSIRIGDREIYQASERGKRTMGGSLVQGV